MTARLPTLFLSHGSPMTRGRARRGGRAWTALGRDVAAAARHADRLRALGDGGADAHRASRSRRPIHDFGGFPDELYTLRYPAPGAPDVAAEAVALLKAPGITAGIDGCRGLDHGAWVPLMHMYPGRGRPGRAAVDPAGARRRAPRRPRGARSRRSRSEGVLIVGSGHVTHNLRDWMMHRSRPGSLPYVGRVRGLGRRRPRRERSRRARAVAGAGAGGAPRPSHRRALPPAARRLRRGRRASPRDAGPRGHPTAARCRWTPTASPDRGATRRAGRGPRPALRPPAARLR